MQVGARGGGGLEKVKKQKGIKIQASIVALVLIGLRSQREVKGGWREKEGIREVGEERKNYKNRKKDKKLPLTGDVGGLDQELGLERERVGKKGDKLKGVRRGKMEKRKNPTSSYERKKKRTANRVKAGWPAQWCIDL